MRLRGRRWLAGGLIAAAVLLVLTAAVRWGPSTSLGRRGVETALSGMKLGAPGRLRISGLRGDLWRDFTVDELQVVDARGSWIEARDVRLRWRPGDLWARRLHVELATARVVTILRRPILTPSGKGGRSPLAVQVDRARLRLVMQPAFSVQRGVYDLAAFFDAEPDGAGRADVAATSVLRPGDFLRVRSVLGRTRFMFDAQVLEARGGALAGSLGLAADQPFRVDGEAAGEAGSGRVVVRTRLGAVEPVSVTGSWSPDGARGIAHVQLAASSLLARYARMLGPVATIALDAREVGEGLYGVGLTARADNLTLHAKGEVDAASRRLGSGGLAADAQTPDAGRMLPGVRLGPARLAGVLRGDPSRWTFTGAGQVDRAQAGGFALASIAGPVRLQEGKGGLDVTADLQGAGGAGRDLLAALLGGRPHAKAEVTFLPAGRILVRNLGIAGAGLRLDATGQRGLLGDLSFKGAATISNLAAAHAGAHGVVKATWTASQGAVSGPWSIGFDAGATNFAAGLGEVDHLLGPAPRLRAAADLGGGRTAVSHATLDGAAGSLGAVGTIGADSAMALILDWRAQGPFQAGPVEIAGAARGSGALTGTLANPRADLMAEVDSIDAPSLALRKAVLRATFASLPGGGDGHFSIAAQSPYGPARGATDFRFVPAGLELTGLDLDAAGVRARGALSLRGGAASTADLTLTVGPGALLAAGQAHGRISLVEDRGGARASLALTAADATLRQGGVRIASLDLRADGPLNALPYRLTAAGGPVGAAWRLAGAGVWAQRSGETDVSFSGEGKARGVPARTLSPILLRVAGPRSSADLHLAIGGGRADIDLARVGEGVSAKASLADIGLALFNPDLVGRIDGTLTATGAGPALNGSALARLTGAGGRDLKGEPPVDGTIRADLRAGRMTLDAAFANAQGLKATILASFPAQATATPFRLAVDRRGALQGRFAIDGELKPVWDLLMGGDRALSGRVAASGILGGSLADPRVVGSVALSGGRFEDAQTGLKLRDVALRADLAGPALDVRSFSGLDGSGGTLSGQGRISLARSGVSSFRLALDRFRLIDNDAAQAAASGTATVSRAADGRVKLTAALAIDKAQIAPKPPVPSGVVDMDVVEIHRPAAAEDEVPAARPPAPVALDVTFKAARGLFVKGRGLDVELSLDGRVEGTTAAPILSGVAHVVRGDYDFAGRRFTFDDRGSVRLASRADQIRLDLTATREDPSLTAVIRIQGTAEKPEITLTSVPALPTDEVLSQVLFGASASQLSGLEAAQLASALAGLSGGGGFDVLGNLRSFAHLDRLAFASGATNSTVVGGKYLRDNLYIELGEGGPLGTSAQLEWRLKKHLSIISRLTTAGASQLSIRWRRDF